MKKSAGILVYRKRKLTIEVFLVHPGGPFWRHKDLGSWSIPKGEFTDEEPLSAAKREFQEETGQEIKSEFIALQPVYQSPGKMVYSWIVEADFDENNLVSNIVELIWPPNSGKKISFPEIDKGGWFEINIAREKILKGQIDLLKQLEHIVK